MLSFKSMTLGFSVTVYLFHLYLDTRQLKVRLLVSGCTMNAALHAHALLRKRHTAKPWCEWAHCHDTTSIDAYMSLRPRAKDAEAVCLRMRRRCAYLTHLPP